MFKLKIKKKKLRLQFEDHTDEYGGRMAYQWDCTVDHRAWQWYMGACGVHHLNNECSTGNTGSSIGCARLYTSDARVIVWIMSGCAGWYKKGSILHSVSVILHYFSSQHIQYQFPVASYCYCSVPTLLCCWKEGKEEGQPGSPFTQPDPELFASQPYMQSQWQSTPQCRHSHSHSPRRRRWPGGQCDRMAES